MGFVSRVGLLSALIAASFASFASFAAPFASAQLPCGILKPCPPPPGPPPPSGGGSETVDNRTHTVYLSISPLELTDEAVGEERIRFLGMHSADGNLAGGHLEIVASPWPYTSSQVIHRSYTHGSFDLQLRPLPVNTQYYARIQVSAYRYVNSPMQKVSLYPDFLSFETDVVKKFVVKMSFRIDLPDAVSYPLAGRKINWYIARGKGKRAKLNRVARSRTWIRSGSAFQNVLTGRVRTRLPRGRYKFRSAFCVDLPLRIDIGMGEPLQEPCP